MISDLFFFGDVEIDKGAMRGTLKSSGGSRRFNAVAYYSHDGL